MSEEPTGDPYGTFEDGKHTYKVWMVGSTWDLRVYGEGEQIREEQIPMGYEPRFGPDASDLRRLEDRIEAIIIELSGE